MLIRCSNYGVELVGETKDGMNISDKKCRMISIIRHERLELAKLHIVGEGEDQHLHGREGVHLLEGKDQHLLVKEGVHLLEGKDLHLLVKQGVHLLGMHLILSISL